MFFSVERRCVLSALLATGLWTGACSDEGGDPPAHDARSMSASDADAPVPADARPLDAGQESTFSVSWTLQGGCLDGDELELQIDSKFDGRIFVERVPCSASGNLSSDPLIPGIFDVQLRLIDNDLANLPDAGPVPDGGTATPMPGPLVAESDLRTEIESIANTAVPIVFEFPTNTATISSSWSFATQDGNQSCAEAGVAFVDLEYERVGVGIERTIRHGCSDLSDASGDLPTGLYLIRAQTRDAGEAVVHAQIETSTPLFVGNRERSASFGFGTL